MRVSSFNTAINSNMEVKLVLYFDIPTGSVVPLLHPFGLVARGQCIPVLWAV